MPSLEGDNMTALNSLSNALAVASNLGQILFP